MSLAGSVKRSKGGNYTGRRFTLDDWTINPEVTDFTSKPWFNGKPCKRCGSTKRFLGASRQCVRCLKQWRKENRHKWARTVRDYDMRANPLYKSHKFRTSDYDKILALQGGLCAICKCEPLPKIRFATDHCHDTGNFRGLLCNACNRALGLFKDDPERIRAAAIYLEENPWTEL